MFDEPSPSPATHREYAGEGHYVTVQHCDWLKDDGNYCNAYLGVEYPSPFCAEHRKQLPIPVK